MDKKTILIALILLGMGWSFYKFSEKKVVQRKEAEPVVLTFLKVKGKVTLEKEGKIIEVIEGVKIDSKCKITSLENSYAVMGYGKDFSSKIKIGPSTSFNLAKFEIDLPDQKDGLDFNLIAGDLLLRIFNPSKQKVLRIKTKMAAMGIRGTTFFVKANEKDSLLIVKEGTVQLESGNEMKPPIFVYGDSGYRINSSGEPVAVSLSQYKMNWQIEDLEPTIIENNFSKNINFALEIVKQNISNLNNDLSKRKSLLNQLEKSNDEEFINLKKDTACLDAGMNQCELISRVSKNDTLELTKAKHFVSASIINKLKDDIEKYRVELIGQYTTMKIEIAEIEKKISQFENKFKLASAKLKQFDSLEEVKKEESKKLIFKDIVDILEDENLKNEFEKI